MLVLASAMPVAALEDEPELDELIGEVATFVEVDPSAGNLVVTNDYRFVNPTADEAFTGFFETLPWDVAAVSAVTASGEALIAVGTPARDGFAEWLISFPEPLQPDQALELSLTWRRDELSSTPEELDLVSPDLVAIAPYAAEHHGTSSLTIEVLGEFDVVEGEGLLVERGDEMVTLSTTEVEGYRAVPVVLEAPDRFGRARATAAGLDVTVATPEGFRGLSVERIETFIADLSEWIPLGAPAPMEFRLGYTGDEAWRVTADGAMVLPVEAEDVVALRIVADTWLASLDFVDPELRSAFAAAIADRVAAAAGAPLPARRGPWTTALEALVSVSDSSTVSTVVAALDAGVPAYAGVGDEFVDEPIGWQRFTDVYEHVGGVQATPAAMRLSVAADQLIELDRRDVALLDYRALEERAAPWALPPLLRDAMAAWDFDAAAAHQGPISDLVGARDEMITAAEGVSLQIGPFVQDRFETADEAMDRAWELYVEQRETLDVVAEALRLEGDERGLLSSLGMLGRDADGAIADVVTGWNAGDFEHAAGRAEELIEEYDTSVGRGTLRLVLPLAALVAVGLAGQALLRRRRARRVAQFESA